MKTKLINDGPQKTYVLVLDKGDEVISSIEGFARENHIAAAQLTGIGACSDAVLGFFDWETKAYRKIPVAEQVEVVSLLGDVALGADGDPALHPHVVVSRADGIAMGGHLLQAHVRPTLEVVLTESPRHLHKRKDAESGLALIVAEDSGDARRTAYREDRHRSPAGAHHRRGPLGAGGLPDPRNCRHDHRVRRIVGAQAQSCRSS